MNQGAGDQIVVRVAGEADIDLAGAASKLIAAAALDHDVARRSPRLLREKILNGHAVVALEGNELVGFGFWSVWQNDRFVSHSGLVVRADRRDQSLGRRLKWELTAASRRRHPEAALMSLTSSRAVQAMNKELGFVRVSLDHLTLDPAFWRGCESCRNHAELAAHPDRCRCDGMILRPEPPE